jgi:hypothetical protein
MEQPTKQLTELEADLKERFDKLPKDVQQAILAVDYEKVLKEITQRYHLHIDQGAKLETETTLVMLGLVSPKEYSKSLIFEARIDPKAAEFIAGEVNEKIFRPIISSLHEVLMRQLGRSEEDERLGEDRSHALSPVEIGVSTVALPEKEKVPDSTVPPDTDKKDIAMFTQKLEGISGEKASETVVDEEPTVEKGGASKPSKTLYKGKLDPYHEPIE